MKLPPNSRTRLAAVAMMLAGINAHGQQLILNGGFETGLSGWTVTVQAGGAGTWTIDDGNGSTPVSASETVGPAAGLSYAVSDQSGAGAHALTQSFVVPGSATAVALAFDLFVNDWSAGGGIVDPVGLDYSGPPNQHARVDILTGVASPLSTAPGDVLANFYLGVDPGSPPVGYSAYSMDLTSIVTAGGTYQIRFAEVDNVLFLNMGVDNVSVLAVPEPGGGSLAAALVLAGLAGAVGWRRFRR